MESGVPSSLEGLTHLGLRGGVDMRPTLLRVLTDLYVQKLTHTADEERHYTELALRLLDTVDVATRTAVATRLTRHLSPPLRVIQYLAVDLPDVAAIVRGHPVLQRHAIASEPPAQSDMAPPDTATSDTAPQHATEATVTVPAAVAAVAEIHDGGFEAPEEPDAETRPGEELPDTIGDGVASELNELFFAATADERRLILLNLEIAVPTSGLPTRIARDPAIGPQLERAALTRNRQDFAQHLARSLQIPRAQALRIAGDELGEPMVVAAKALNMPRDLVYRILLFVNTTVGHSVERVHTLASLYDEMTVKTAEHIVSIWQALDRDERHAPQHRPLLWNDEARARARTATTAVRRAPAERARERRDAS